jgi:hypothetical protein
MIDSRLKETRAGVGVHEQQYEVWDQAMIVDADAIVEEKNPAAGEWD